MDDSQSLCLLSPSYFIWIHGFKQYLFDGHTHIFISSHNHFLVEQIIVGNEQQTPWAPGEVVSQAQNSRCSCWGWGLPCVSRSSWKGLGKEDRWSGVCFCVTAMAVERRMDQGCKHWVRPYVYSHNETTLALNLLPFPTLEDVPYFRPTGRTTHISQPEYLSFVIRNLSNPWLETCNCVIELGMDLSTTFSARVSLPLK